MQGAVILRLAGVFALAATLTACNPSMHSAAGQTPVPSQTTMAQANSTAPPSQRVSMTPGEKYFMKTGAGLHGITFSVWANGRPIASALTPGASIDITPELRGHANVVVIQWERTAKNGVGTATVGTAKKTVLTATVTAHSPAKGEVSKTFIAAQTPVGR